MSSFNGPHCQCGNLHLHAAIIRVQSSAYQRATCAAAAVAAGGRDRQQVMQQDTKLTAHSSIHSILHCSAYITDTLANLYWLRASKRIQFKLAVIIYQAFTARHFVTCPANFVMLLTCCHEVVSICRPPVRWMSIRHVESLLGAKHLLLLVPGSGTASPTLKMVAPPLILIVN